MIFVSMVLLLLCSDRIVLVYTQQEMAGRMPAVQMRTSEWISLLFLALFTLLALIRHLPIKNRVIIVALGISGIALLWLGIHQIQIRDWVPTILMVIVYWQGGRFFSNPHKKLQDYLEKFEKNFSFLDRKRPHLYWEIAYFLCYPMVPGAVATLYALDLTSRIDFFWTIVLAPTFLCHLIVSFYQSLPPWKYRNLTVEGFSRKMNFLVIRHASIQINTFPSAHVAASMAVAFAMMHLSLIAGLVFLFIGLSITIATVVGRYHYAADAVWGVVLAAGWYLITLTL
jgi:hypothetical protein